MAASALMLMNELLWRIRYTLKHPLTAHYTWKKHRAYKRLEVNDLVSYHDEGPFRIVSFDEYGDLNILPAHVGTDEGETPLNVNFMHCCGIWRDK